MEKLEGQRASFEKEANLNLKRAKIKMLEENRANTGIIDG